MELAESVRLAKALSDRSRLLILRELAAGPLCSEELAARLDLAPSTISFHSKKLSQAGLIAGRREQYYSFWELVPESMRLTLAELASFTARPQTTERRRRSQAEVRVGKAFFSGGRLLRMPVQRGKRQLVLEHFASLFEQGREYGEREVDALIRPVFSDYCLVRRLLVDEGYLERSAGTYRRSGRPAVAMLDTGSAEGGGAMNANDERKRMKEEYKSRQRVAGIFTVTNTVDGKVFLGSCLDAERPLRRIRFELQLGSFKNRELQNDYARLGEDAFRFAVLESVPTSAEDPEEELERLEEKHLAGLDPSASYNTDSRIRFR